MDLLEAKSRIAEALVESIFRRARYRVDRFHTEQFPLRFGREDFSPDFRASLETGTGEPFELLLEVKYRPHIDQFISVENQRGDRSVFLMARRQWPKLYFVLVTEHPEPGRSCFQVISYAVFCLKKKIQSAPSRRPRPCSPGHDRNAARGRAGRQNT